MLSWQWANKDSHCSKGNETLGDVWPAGILILLTVDKWAGFQLAAYHWCTVIAESGVTIHTLRFRVTVHARDWEETNKTLFKSRGKQQHNSTSKTEYSTSFWKRLLTANSIRQWFMLIIHVWILPCGAFKIQFPQIYWWKCAIILLKCALSRRLLESVTSV